MVMGCIFWLATFSVFRIKFYLMMTAKQQANFEDQVLGLFLSTKTRRKIIARTVRAESAGVKN